MEIDPLFRKALAEGVGIFAFFFAGIGAIVANQGVVASGTTVVLIVAFAHGIMLAIMVSALGAVSGGHFNPAVTLGLFVGRMIDVRTLVVYWAAQLIGAILAAVAVTVAFPKVLWNPSHIGLPALGSGVGFGTGVFIEALLTFFLVLAVYGTAVDPRHPPIGGLAIGLTVFVDILVGAGQTGAAMNPARAFGPAVVSSTWTNQLVYWIGPLIGGAVAGVLFKTIFWQTPAETTGQPAAALEPGLVRPKK
jgi:MIP family channel proteins